MSKLYEDYTNLKFAIGKLQKSGKNPHFKNTFVELNTILQVVDNELKKHNFLCFIQTPINIDGKNYLHTVLIHKEGEKIESDLELITTKQDPQMLGSSLTYARRYSLITMLGLQAVDDDGNLGAGHEPVKQPPVQQKPKLTDDEYITKASEAVHSATLPDKVEKIKAHAQKWFISKPDKSDTLIKLCDAKLQDLTKDSIL